MLIVQLCPWHLLWLQALYGQMSKQDTDRTMLKLREGQIKVGWMHEIAVLKHLRAVPCSVLAANLDPETEA